VDLIELAGRVTLEAQRAENGVNHEEEGRMRKRVFPFEK